MYLSDSKMTPPAARRARACAFVMPKDETTKLLITHAAAQTNAIAESLATVAREMKRLAQTLPEYAVVIEFRGVGKILAPQLIAEIGDVRRFSKKSKLVTFAGLAPTENQSGAFQGDAPISKQGSPRGVANYALFAFGLKSARKAQPLRCSAFSEKSALRRANALFSALPAARRDRKRAEGSATTAT
jgi:transposase